MNQALRISLVAVLLISFQGNGSAQVADKAELYTGKEFSRVFANPRDNNDLPNVLLIGDSISIGYTVEVRKSLRGKADVFRIPSNGQTAAYGLKHLDKWLGNRKWDVIHFNWGLWDICYRDPESKTQGHRDKLHGALTATPEQYQESMEKIVARLKETNAKLIWCATTPVPKLELGRKEGDEVKYNAIAKKIMDANEIATNDLHAYALLKTPNIQAKQGDVHFNKRGYRYLADKVARELSQALQVQGE